MILHVTLQKKKMSQSVKLSSQLMLTQCSFLRTMNIGQMIRYYQIQSWEQCNEDDPLLYNICIVFNFKHASDYVTSRKEKMRRECDNFKMLECRFNHAN